VKEIIISYIKGFWSLLFPEVCKKCGEQLLGHQEILCNKCISDLPRTGFEKNKDNPVVQAFWGKVQLVHAFSVFYFRKGEILQKLIHLLKYKGNRNVGAFLGKLAGKISKDILNELSIDYIIPVPLHPKRLRTRGYNQCELIANEISEMTNIPVITNVLKRAKYNKSQTTKGKYERWENVKGIFILTQPELFENKHILIIDDIITTGSTVEACCYALLEVKNIKISIMSICSTSY
jgi:ComF family protein